MQRLEKQYETIQALNASKVELFYSNLRREAATKIQARWRGIMSRRNKKIKINTNNSKKQELNDQEQRIKSIVERIQRKISSKSTRQELGTKVEIITKYFENKDLFQHPPPFINYITRVESWVDAIENKLERSKEEFDESATAEILMDHKNELLAAKRGWWHRQYSTEDDFDVLLSELERGIKIKQECYY